MCIFLTLFISFSSTDTYSQLLPNHSLLTSTEDSEGQFLLILYRNVKGQQSIIPTQRSNKQSLQMLQAPPLILLGKGTQTLAYVASKTGNSEQRVPSICFPGEGKSFCNRPVRFQVESFPGGLSYYHTTGFGWGLVYTCKALHGAYSHGNF